MKRFKKFKVSWLFISILLTIVACNEKDDPLSASGDVIYVKKASGDYPVFGVSYHVLANKALSSANVILPYGNVLELKQNATNTYLFENEPSDSDFTSSEPSAGDYVFNIVSESGEQIEVFEQQKFDNLQFAEIDSMDFDEENDWLGMRWKEVDGAGVYTIMLLKLSGETIFNGYNIDATKGHKYAISYFHHTGSWSEAPQKGNRYNLKITAMKFDEDAVDNMDIFNIQEISEYVQEITWELE
ncbi:MAG: hypothetical protein LBV47_03305 [Bacteroidales bacterium]|jgi:hypothetical protein|nr:hypothetical protein [Bacteroidales bacterium]